MVFTWVKTPLVLAPNQHSCNRTARHGGPPASLLCVPGAQDGTCHGFLNKCPRLIPQGNSRSEGPLPYISLGESPRGHHPRPHAAHCPSLPTLPHNLSFPFTSQLLLAFQSLGRSGEGGFPPSTPHFGASERT